MEAHREFLRERVSELLTNRQAVLVFGSGITMQATKGAKTASWAGLLHSGIDHCVAFGAFASDEERQKWAEAARAGLQDSDPKSYVKVAGEIERVLKDLSSERQEWLRKAIGGLKVRDAKVLAAIKGLVTRFGPTLLTTNYDSVLSSALEVDNVTWEDADAVVKILKGNSLNVLHIHGFWRKPGTVVLGTESYEKLLNNPAAQNLQHAVTALNSLVFIGCGDGIKDDNIGGLLKWFETALPDNAQRHYILLREAEVKNYPASRWLVPVSYGPTYDDLPRFLDTLTPVMDPDAVKRQLEAARALIMRLAEAWTSRNHSFSEDNASSSVKSVAGSWKGQQTQQTGPAFEPITYPVALDLALDGVKVTGTFYFQFDPVGKPLIDEAVDLEGQLDHGRFLRLSYQGGEDDTLQFGTLLLELTADGDTLIGNDVGYGYTTRQTLMAMTRLRRSAPLDATN
jgi:hypothetical protein